MIVLIKQKLGIDNLECYVRFACCIYPHYKHFFLALYWLSTLF